ncbi:MAG: thiopurine S-methyltransferase [Wenzhouxiangella sp.]
MNPEFWHERWQQQQIGFHEGQANQLLCRYWPQLVETGQGQVFVPLCGKSVDMLWLRQRGHSVLGVELSELAAQAFFEDHDLPFEQDSLGSFLRFHHDGIEIWCGDVFDLTPDHLAGVGYVYDRASLIALPANLRARYAQHLIHCLPSASQGLLISLAYPDGAMQGPPFSVADEEVRRLLSPGFELERLYHQALTDDNPLRQRGLVEGSESVFRLTRFD